MKKSLLFLFGLCLTAILQAQVYKTVECTAGHLTDSLTLVEKSTITNLTVTGTMDARDFKTMRDSMEVLAVIDLNSATIAAYTGTYGTAGTGSIAYAANAVPDHGFSFLSGYNLKLLSVILPSSANTIGTSAFGYCKSLTSVTIPSSVTVIGGSAFCYCSKLTSVAIPSNVTSIGSFAFGQCTSLTSIVLPPNLVSIGSLAFYTDDGLTSLNINIPASVTSIGDQAFAGCNGTISVDAANPNFSSLSGVLFNKTQTTLIQCLTTKTGSYSPPSTVTTIGTWSFYDCNNLGSITLLSNVTNIQSYAFVNCNNLAYFDVPSSVLAIGYGAFNQQSGYINVEAGNPNYSSEDGVLFNKSQTLLIACSDTMSGSYTIPSSVTSVGEMAFFNVKINSVTIPSSVTTIGGMAFFDCLNLMSIQANMTVPPDLSSSSEVFFADDFTNCTLYVPDGSFDAYSAANQWKDFTHIIEGNGFWLSVSELNIGNSKGSTATADVHSNTAWTANSDQDWLMVDPETETTGDATLTFTAEANPILDSRMATITVSSTGLTPQTITVTQDAGVETSVPSKTNEEVSFYPIPVKDKLYLSNVVGVKQIKIYSIDGCAIANLKNITANYIDLSRLDKGVYVFYVTTRRGTFCKKIVKE